MPPDARKYLVESHETLSLTKQTALLDISRTSIYKRPTKGISDETVQLMHRIDRIHTDEPTWGYRTITAYLRNSYGVIVNRKRGPAADACNGHLCALSQAKPVQAVSRAVCSAVFVTDILPIIRPNQVWGVDITYIPVGRSFVYLFVIIDWYSRYIVDWELSLTLEKTFVLKCLRRALSGCKPEIINSDQGGHFTNPDYIALLNEANVHISMDGKGQCLDNARTERFFRTLKYDRVYIDEYETPRDIRLMLNQYIPKYNRIRPHSSVDYLPPESRYFEKQILIA